MRHASTTLLLVASMFGTVSPRASASSARHELYIGPIPDWTIDWHPAPQTSAIPLGARVRFRLEGLPSPADLDNDGSVGDSDLLIFAQCYGGPSNPIPPTCASDVNADLDGDLDVDIADFLLFARLFQYEPTDNLDWIGAVEIQRTASESIAEADFDSLGPHTVTARVSHPLDGQIFYEFHADVVDTSPSNVLVSATNVLDATSPVDGLPPGSDVLPLFYTQSIARVQELSPSAYTTSIDRPVRIAVTVDPPAFASIIEWRVDDLALGLGVDRTVTFSQSGDHTLAIGPPPNASSSQWMIYNVIISPNVNYRTPPPPGPITFTATTDPPGYESNVTWISGTLHGTAVPATTVGPNLTVSFDDTMRADPNSGIQQWYGVRADNADTGRALFVAATDPAADDANPGSSDQPWSSLSHSANEARPNDTIVVGAGTYHETLSPFRSGTPTSPITFVAAVGDAPVIDGDYQRSHAVNLDGRSHIRVEGLEMHRHTSSAIYVSEFGSSISDGIQIIGNHLHHNDGWGVYARGAPYDLLVEANEIHDVWRGVQIGGGAIPRGVTIRNNHIYQTYCDGIRGAGDDLLIEGNWIHDAQPTGCHRDGLDLSNSGRHIIVRNNLIYDYTQLIYFPTGDDPNTLVEDVSICGNILFTDEYPGDPDGEAPGIFISTNTELTSTIRHVDIHSNTVAWVGLAAIRLRGENIFDVSLYNNIFVDAPISVSPETDPRQIRSDYNLFYTTRGSKDDATPWTFEGSNSIIGQDPQFLNYRRHAAWDFRLGPGSPAIDAGDPALESKVSIPDPFLDMNGVQRPVRFFLLPGPGAGGAFDIGALEREPLRNE